MNPASTLRLRRVTGLMAAAWALLAIGVSISALFTARETLTLPLNCSFIGAVAMVESATDAARAAGVTPGDRLLSVDGEPVLRFMWRVSSGEGVLQNGVPNTYVIQKRSGELQEVRLDPAPPEFSARPIDPLLHVALLLVACSYLAIGLVVWWNRSTAAETWALMLFCGTMAVMIAAAIRVHLAPWSASLILANMPWLGATTFHLFTTYPVEPRWVQRQPRVRGLPYALALVMSALVFLDGMWGVADAWITGAAFLSGVGLSLGALAVGLSERRNAHQAGLGDRADLMLTAGIVTLLPVMLVLLAEYFLQLRLPWYLAMLWVVFFPAVVGYGMVRKQLFDFRILAKSSAAYGAVTLAITGLYASIIALADAVVPQFGVDVRGVQVAFLFLAILAVNPLRDRMQRLVDNFFDRDRARYRTAVREISEAMVSMLSMREISDRILVALTDTMGVERAMVLLFDENEKVLTPAAWRGDWEEEHTRTEIPSEHPIWKHLWMRREELARQDFDDEADPEKRDDCWDVFDTLEVELLVPILFGVDLLGVVAVGRKLSGERLAADDRQLLRTLANQSAIAIENAKAFDEIAKLNETLEARVEERTRELRDTQAQLMQAEKLKSMGQLVAGVAHELNNPIGFVHANLQLLDEFTTKLVDAQAKGEDIDRYREAIEKLLIRSREGTERVKQIVMDLRSFSRTDQAELQDVDLHEEIDRTLALMEPRLKGGIEVVREYGELPEVRCFPGQLNQVFLNLLMNACDVLAPEGTITVRTTPLEDGVRLEFSDDGPGIPADVQSRIFDPFFTTKPVGQGTGLGLSLSHGIIDRHGGRISVESEPGEGTRFVIELPLVAAPAVDE